MESKKLRHGMSNSPLYRVWYHMKSRCLNHNDSGYSNYGGRGINICRRWLEFKPFYQWARDKWQPGLLLDRVNNDGDYTPDNCRFVTPSISNINTRRHRNNKTGYVGVSRRRNGKYRSQLSIEYLGGRVNLGCFGTPEQAVSARNDFIIKNNLPHKIQEII